MSKVESYSVALFDSTSATLLAEKLLKKGGISFKVIPVPRHISSDCGVCIRFFSADQEKVKHTLKDKVHVQEIRPL